MNKSEHPFVAAVTRAIELDSDNWEIEYYYVVDRGFIPRRLAVFLQTRASALGPEWKEF